MNIPKNARKKHLEVTRQILAGYSTGAVARKFNIPTDKCFAMFKAVVVEALRGSNKSSWKLESATSASQILKEAKDFTPDINELETFWGEHA